MTRVSKVVIVILVAIAVAGAFLLGKAGRATSSESAQSLVDYRGQWVCELPGTTITFTITPRARNGQYRAEMLVPNGTNNDYDCVTQPDGTLLCSGMHRLALEDGILFWMEAGGSVYQFRKKLGS